MKNMDEIKIYQEFYYELKEKYPDCVLLFFLDDCRQYVAYNKDAETLAKILDEPHTEIKLDENLWIPAIYIELALLDRVIQKAVRSGKRVVLKENYEQTIENKEMETKREIKTILDLKKGDKVYGGLRRTGGGCCPSVSYPGTFNVRKMVYEGMNEMVKILLELVEGVPGSIWAHDLVDGKLFLTEEDFYNQECLRKVDNVGCWDFINKKYNVVNQKKQCGVWHWSECKEQAVEESYWTIDLLSDTLPKGLYATKEECEKANKKTVKVRVIHEFETEVDEDYAEDLVENPGEYEFKEGDECHASAEIIN